MARVAHAVLGIVLLFDVGFGQLTSSGTNTPPPATVTVCPSTWYGFNGNCYKAYYEPLVEDRLSWYDAKAFCQSISGAHLISIDDAGVENFIGDTLIDSFLLGSYWIGFKSELGGTARFTWSDGSLTTYTNWARGEPNFAIRQDDCVQYTYGLGWDDGSCYIANNWICEHQGTLALATTQPTTTPPSTIAVNCASGWSQLDDQCFIAVDLEINWLAAESLCQNQFAHLANVPDNRTQQFVEGLLGTHRYWLGLNDRHSEGSFSYLDETAAISFTAWKQGQPAGLQVEGDNCVLSDGDNNQHGRWEVNQCDGTHRILCQRPLRIPQVTASTNFDATGCGVGWESYPEGVNCYLFEPRPLTWTDARQTCVHNGGDLASPHDTKDLAFITGRLRCFAGTEYWIGASDRALLGGWQWVDGGPFSFMNWKQGEPNINSHILNCAAMFTDSGLWGDEVCDARKPYVCEKRIPAPSIPPTVPAVTPSPTAPAGFILGCPSGWFEYIGNCYKFDDVARSWTDADEYCRNTLHGELVSIADINENYFVAAVIFTETTTFDPVWIGMQLVQSTYYVWSDKSDVTLTNWKFNHPDYFLVNGARESCVAMEESTEKWATLTCNQLHNSVCKKKLIAVANDTGNPFGVGCPTGSVGFESVCYTYVAQPDTWQSAAADCVQLGGSLAVINDRFVQAFVSSELVGKTSDYWIGMSDLNSEGRFRWSSGQPVLYSNWAITHTGNERNSCVALSSNRPVGLWVNAPCDVQRSYVCQSDRQGFTTPIPVTGPAGSCPNSWVERNNYCYKLFHNNTFGRQLSWIDAQNDCHYNYGGDLPSIHSAAEDQFILHSVIDPSTINFWIGLSDRDVTTGYQWVDLSGLDYTNWISNEPDNHGNAQSCVIQDTSVNGWSDTYCYLTNKWVCKARKGAVVPTPIYTCDAGWILIGSQCYIVSNFDTKYLEAQHACTTAGANLANIPDQTTQDILVGMLDPTIDYYIGINDRVLDGRFVWLTDTTEITYTAWGNTEPNNYFDTGENCVTLSPLYAGLWNDVLCDGLGRFICMKVAAGLPTIAPTPTPSQTTVVSAKCGPGWVEDPNSDFCYQFHTDHLSWFDAQTTCIYYGGNLASIHSSAEASFINANIDTSVTFYSMGATDRNLEGGWTWIDNSPFEYFDWSPGQPDNAFGLENCAQIWFDNRWNDHNCLDHIGYVCKKNGNVPATVPPAVNATTPSSLFYACQGGWYPYADSCYQINTDNQNWVTASNTCNQRGGQLTSITNRDEENFVLSFIAANATASNLWIGFSDIRTSLTFEWNDNATVTYTNWAPFQPNTGGGVQNCILIHSTLGQWQTDYCDGQHGYICKMPKALYAQTTRSPLEVGCQDGELGYGSYCYDYHNNITLSWTGARAQCQAEQSELAIINDRKAHAFVSAEIYIEGSNMDYWIGVSNRNSPKTYTWINGDPAIFTPWSALHTGNERASCVAMSGASPIGLWKTEDCASAKNFICRHPRIGYTIPPVTTAVSIQCPTNWHAFNDYCYQFFENAVISQEKIWIDAENYCRTLGGSLVSYHSPGEEQFVSSQVVDPSYVGTFWIGLGERSVVAGYRWSDASALEYTNWLPSYPRPANALSDCVLYRNSATQPGWLDENCLVGHNFVCKVKSSQFSTQVITTDICSRSNLTTIDGACYYVDLTSSVTWSGANYECLTKGMQLASIHDSSELGIVVQDINIKTTVTVSAWIGMLKSETGAYVWSDTTTVDYYNWNPTSVPPAREDVCISMASNTGRWSYRDCSEARGFVCKATARGFSG